MSELHVQNENKLVRENCLWSGKSQGKVREFCFTQIVDTLLLLCLFSPEVLFLYKTFLCTYNSNNLETIKG